MNFHIKNLRKYLRDDGVVYVNLAVTNFKNVFGRKSIHRNGNLRHWISV